MITRESCFKSLLESENVYYKIYGGDGLDIKKIENVKYILTEVSDISTDICRDVMNDYIACMYPGYDILKKFVEQFANKDKFSLKEDDPLYKIIYEPINYSTLPVKTNNNIEGQTDEFKISGSKIKNKKDKTEKKSTSVNFDVFNTF